MSGPSSGAAQPLVVRDLGRRDYRPVWQAMQAFTMGRGPDTADELWLLEHNPVFTLGQGLWSPWYVGNSMTDLDKEFGPEAGILWLIFASSNRSEKLAHTIFLVAVVGFSMLFGLVDNGTIDAGLGIVQRCVYLSGFAWLIYQEHTFVNKRQTQASFQKEFAS